MNKKDNNKKVAVGSKNPAKIKAAEDAFRLAWPDIEWEVFGVGVDSGVSPQPMSDNESIEGARNRARKALEKTEDADYGVGMEGGLENIHGRYYDCGWIVVLDKNGKEGVASTVKMEVAPKIVKMIKEGKELGEALDLLYERKDVSMAEGFFGLMTNNIFVRSEGHRDAVVSALVPFVQEDIFQEVKTEKEEKKDDGRIDYRTRPLAITDLETTGLKPVEKYEIIEIGLVLADQETLEIIDTLNLKVRPERIEDADPESLEVNGYKEENWKDAISLKEAMEIYSEKTEGAIFAAHNVPFDWEYIERAFFVTGVENKMDYHFRELSTIASEVLRKTELNRESLRRIASFLGVEPEPEPHRAINGATTAYEVYRRIRLILDKGFKEGDVEDYITSL